MKYIVNAIVNSIIEQNPQVSEQLRIRICGFEDVRIYEAVAKRIHEIYDNSVSVETRLSKEKWIEFKNDPKSNQAAMLSLEANDWIANNNSLTYYRNRPLSEVQLIIIMGTEVVDDQGGLNDFYYIDPDKLTSNLGSAFHSVFAPIEGGWSDEDIKCVDKLYGDLFSLIPINICKLSTIADKWGTIPSIEDFIIRFYKELPDWGLCYIEDNIPSVNRICKSEKTNLLQTNFDFVTRKLFKNMTQTQYAKYLLKIEKYQKETEQYTGSWEGWQFQSIHSLLEYVDVLCQYIRGENIERNRQKLLGVDFSVTEYVLGIALPGGGPKPKKTKFEVTGSPYVSFLKAICTSLACEDPAPFNALHIKITSIELANAIDPLSDNADCDQLSDNWRRVCWFAGGILDYLSNLGFSSKGYDIDIVVDEDDPFNPECADLRVADGLIIKASASKKLDKVKFTVTHYFNDTPTEISQNFEWNFTLNDDWVIAFDQLLSNYETWDEQQYDSVIPVATVDNYEVLMGSKCEEEFLDAFEQSSIEYELNLVEEAKKHKENPKAIAWQAEFSMLGRSFIEFCRSLRKKGFFGDLLQNTKGDSKSAIFVDKYVKLGSQIVNSSFVQNLEWVMDFYIHAFAIEESLRFFTINEEAPGCIIPPYHPAILQKLIDQTVFLADGACEWIHEHENDHPSLDRISDMVNELIQLSQIQEGVDVFPSKDGKFGTTHAFSNYCLCGVCKSSSQKWMKAIMKKDAVFDDDFNDSVFKRMNVSAKMLFDVFETYSKALPNYTTNLSIAVIDPDDLQPIIAAIYQFILINKKNLENKKETLDNGRIIRIRLHILVHPENKGGRNYLSYWANTFFNQDENVDLKIYLNEWNDRDDLEKLLDTNLDLVFLMDVLRIDDLRFVLDPGNADGTISDCRFPIVFKPAPVSKASIKRNIELTQRQFSAATIHSQVVYYKLSYESYEYKKQLVVRNVSIDSDRKELILMLHRKANWVVCVDGGMDGALLRDSEGKNNDYDIIGFSTGKGPHGQYNLTITARNSIIDAVEKRLKSRLQKAFAWDKAKTFLAANVCMTEARNLDGVSLLSAINPKDENINEFLAYIMASLQTKKKRIDSALHVVVHLDSYQHWFENSVLEEELDTRSRPDFLEVTADIGENGVIQLEATVIECKIAKYEYADERISDATKQVFHGIERLSKIFDPCSKSIRRRYWFAQLYRALAFSQITFQSDTQAFTRLAEEMRNILEGNFEIKWSGRIMGYWKDMPGDEEKISQISTSPLVQLIEVPQKRIQRILLNDETADVEYVVVEEPAVDTTNDEDVVYDGTKRRKTTADSTSDSQGGTAPERGKIDENNNGDDNTKLIPFSEDEAIILLSYLFKEKELSWSRSITAEKASIALRSLAEKRGMALTDSFRTPAGLAGRLRVLEATLNGSDTSTKIFEVVCRMFKENNEQFMLRLESLLNELGSSTDTRTEEQEPAEIVDSDSSHNSQINTETISAKAIEEIRVYIGKDRNGNKVYWDFGHPKLANRHLLITGTSGQGKTYSIQTMLRELAKNGISSVIFDYTEGFREDQLEPAFRNTLKDKITQNIVYFTGIPIDPFRRQEIEVGGLKAPEKISDVAQRIATIFTHVYDFGEQQFAAIYEACSSAISTYGAQTDMNRFREKLGEVKNAAAKTVMSKMIPFFDSVEFQPGSSFDWNSVINADGSVIIFQLTNYVREIQVIITELMLWDAWHYFKKNGDKNTPFVVVLDEAQNLSMKMGSPAEIILREGRKFGWSAWFATQSLKSLSDVEVVNLHQAPYSLYFKPTDDEIVKISKQIDPVSSSNWIPPLKALHKGQCIVVGDRVRADGVFGAIKPTITNITSFEEREKEEKTNV